MKHRICLAALASVHRGAMACGWVAGALSWSGVLLAFSLLLGGCRTAASSQQSEMKAATAGKPLVAPWPSSYPLPVVPMSADLCLMMDALSVSPLAIGDEDLECIEEEPDLVVYTFRRGGESNFSRIQFKLRFEGRDIRALQVAGDWRGHVGSVSGWFVDLSGWAVLSQRVFESAAEPGLLATVFMQREEADRGCGPLAVQCFLPIRGRSASSCSDQPLGRELLQASPSRRDGRDATPRASGSLDEWGMRHGVWTTVHKNGRPRTIGRYKHGCPQGNWVGMDDAGGKLFDGSLDLGLRAGEWMEWRGQGDARVCFVGPYFLGRKTGLWRGSYINGRLHSVGLYRFGERQGEWQFYKSDGRPHSRGAFLDGVAVGEWSYWDDEGVGAKKVEIFADWR